VVTRYADVVAALHDARFSKAQGMAAALERFPEAERESARPVYRFFSKQLLYADPPYHTRLRLLANKAFTPRAVESMRAHIQYIVDGLLNAFVATGPVDAIQQFAYPLPIIIVMDMLGLPESDRGRFKEWSDDFAATLGVVQRAPHLMEKARHSLVEFADYLGNFQEQHCRGGHDDLLTAFYNIEEQGQRLSREELVANAMLLLAAGHETTTNLIGNGLLALLRHPIQMRALADNPAWVPDAVEEMLRYDSPVQIVWRLAIQDLALGGKQIRQGQLVNMVLGAANRDPAQFPEPDRFDVRRSANRHVGFSLGTHFCLGAPLARLEGQIAFETLVRRLPTLRLASEALEWRESTTFRGVKSLPVIF
jgi:cytochrome P450